MKGKLNRFSLLLCFLAILSNGCVANNFCHRSDQLEYVTWVSALEIIDANKIRVTKETGAPVHFIDAEGDAIESNILGLSDSIVLRDEHYGAEFKVIGITQETVYFAVDEGWSYPVSGWCNPGQSSGTIKLEPYDTDNKHFEQTSSPVGAGPSVAQEQNRVREH